MINTFKTKIAMLWIVWVIVVIGIGYLMLPNFPSMFIGYSILAFPTTLLLTIYLMFMLILE